MHSRIFEISKTPVDENERFSSSDIPDNFYHSVADYTDDAVDRFEDIKWLISGLKSIISKEEGDKFIFKEGYKQIYFRRKHSEFVSKAAELSRVSLDVFCGDESSVYPMDMEMFKLRGLYDGHFEFYVYFEDELMTLDYWIRHYDLSGTLYVGGIVDYHY